MMHTYRPVKVLAYAYSQIHNLHSTEKYRRCRLPYRITRNWSVKVQSTSTMYRLTYAYSRITPNDNIIIRHAMTNITRMWYHLMMNSDEKIMHVEMMHIKSSRMFQLK